MDNIKSHCCGTDVFIYKNGIVQIYTCKTCQKACVPKENKPTLQGYNIRCQCDNCLIPTKTLRDEFAMVALPELMRQAFSVDSELGFIESVKNMAIISYGISDAMLKVREEK